MRSFPEFVGYVFLIFLAFIMILSLFMSNKGPFCNYEILYESGKKEYKTESCYKDILKSKKLLEVYNK